MLEPQRGEYTELLGTSDFELLSYVVEDWQSDGGRTVWLARRRTGSQDTAESTLVGGTEAKDGGANGYE